MGLENHFFIGSIVRSGIIEFFYCISTSYFSFFGNLMGVPNRQ